MKIGAKGGTRTRTPLLRGDFKSPAAAITPLWHINNIPRYLNNVKSFSALRHHNSLWYAPLISPFSIKISKNKKHQNHWLLFKFY